MRTEPRQYKIFASMQENVGEGFVWVEAKLSGRRPILRIRNSTTAIYCEALQIDSNFCRNYNAGANRKQLSCPSSQADPASPGQIVMSEWYRRRLSSADTEIETQKEFRLSLDEPPWFLRWYWRCRALNMHPQLNVRISFWLAALSVLLGLVSVMPAAAEGGGSALRSVARSLGVKPPSQPKQTKLTLDNVLSWRKTYGDLVGRPCEMANQLFGRPDSIDGLNRTWGAKEQTHRREIEVLCGDQGGSEIRIVTVYPAPRESLDVTSVLQSGPLFDFRADYYRDSAQPYFVATKKDKQTSIQFNLDAQGVLFHRVYFTNEN